ncbi:MAG: lytic murein transglycosylase [Labrys sp. (in: a-proteobacteria)]|jgi:membrane-bound lytic murein transglycosylase B
MAARHLRCTITAILVALIASVGANPATARSFSDFLAELWPDAQAKGVSRAVFDAAFAGVEPDPAIIKLATSQPEFNQTMGDYLNDRVSEQRIRVGREMAQRWSTLLGQLEERFGVDRYTILAVWGLETNYGAMTGGKNVVRSLATLACCTARRPEFFRAELITALQILEAHDTDPQTMTGSWAGAMGHTQFMPSSFMKFAVDITGDGHRDIWTSVPDALASTANYLAQQGWQTGKTWGYEVKLPAGFDFLHIDRHAGKTIAVWRDLGIRRVSDRAFPRADDEAWLRVPAGANGPAFLVLRNFDAIRTYNASDAYAISVGHLADRIRGGGGFVRAWPDDEPLSTAQRKALQQRLTDLGYPLTKIDGKIGEETRAALRAWQASAGLVADGYPTRAILRKMGAIE